MSSGRICVGSGGVGRCPLPADKGLRAGDRSEAAFPGDICPPCPTALPDAGWGAQVPSRRSSPHNKGRGTPGLLCRPSHICASSPSGSQRAWVPGGGQVKLCGACSAVDCVSPKSVSSPPPRDLRTRSTGEQGVRMSSLWIRYCRTGFGTPKIVNPGAQSLLEGAGCAEYLRAPWADAM